jgi:adenylate cyclase
MTPILRSRRAPFVLAALVWLLAVGAAGLLDLPRRLENQFLDWGLRSLAARQAPDPDIVLLDIDEATLAAMSADYGRYPWTRAVYGQLLEGLARQKPAAIVFDILVTDPQREHAEDDLYFVRTARALPNVYFPMVRLPPEPGAEENGYPLAHLPAASATPGADPNARAALLLPLPGLADTGRVGTINVQPDAEDGVVRRYPFFTEIGGWRVPSLPARVAQDLAFPLRAVTTTQTLVWHGGARAYRTVSFHEVFADLDRREPRRPAGEFAGKIVIIGASAAGLHDLKLTPVGANFPGPEVLATAIDNLKHGDRLQAAPAATSALLAAIFVLALAFAFSRGIGVFGIGLGWLGTSMAAVAGAWAAIVYARLSVPVVVPVAFGGWLYYILAALRAWFLEHEQRRRVTALFSRFLDPRVVAGLVERGETDAAFAGQKRVVTVLFSDIRGFTTLSERKSPQEVVDLLNRYFSLQVEVIFRHGGTLDKYIGDAIMAFWGAPTEQPDHAARALACAHDMERTLERFKDELGAEGQGFDIGIGINTGEAVVGFIGSPTHRQDYTVIGDTVNTASRIEGATKGRARVLVAGATKVAVGGTAEFVDHGLVKVKGRAEEVHLYEPKWN